MSSMVKKYIPYAVVIAAIYLLVPLVFVLNGTGGSQHPVTYDIIFPLTAIVPSVIFGKKHGIDFFFALVAPIIYIPSMIIYNGINLNNIIFVAIYLVSSIFGLFFGDMFLSKKETESPPLDIDLDIEEDTVTSTRKPVTKSYEKRPMPKAEPTRKKANDDFFDTYYSEKTQETTTVADDEIDKILRELQDLDI